MGLHTEAGTVSSFVGWMGSWFPQGQCTEEELETRLPSTHDREILFTFIASTVSYVSLAPKNTWNCASSPQAMCYWSGMSMCHIMLSGW